MNDSIAKTLLIPLISSLTDTKAKTIKSTNIDDRIDIILEAIDEGKRDPVVRQVLGDILKDIDEKDYEGELLAIFQWVRENIRYTRDPHNVELFQRARRIMELGLADCDCLSILLGSMVQSIGYPLRLRVIGVSSPEPEHIYPMVAIAPTENAISDDDWVAMDASINQQMGWQVPEENIQFIQDYEDDDS